jgi:hypothetical protein
MQDFDPYLNWLSFASLIRAFGYEKAVEMIYGEKED